MRNLKIVGNLYKDNEEYLAGFRLERDSPCSTQGLAPLIAAYFHEVLSSRVAVRRRRLWVVVTQPSDTGLVRVAVDVERDIDSRIPQHAWDPSLSYDLSVGFLAPCDLP